MRCPLHFCPRCSRSNWPVRGSISRTYIESHCTLTFRPIQPGFGEHRRYLALGAAMDALVGLALFPVIQIRLCFFQALELLALQRRLLRMGHTGLNLTLSIWIPHFARQCRYPVVRQDIAI